MVRLPKSMRWLFWESTLGRIDAERDADYVLARVLEFGTMREVRWAVRHYGRAKLLEFFRRTHQPEVSARTRAFWRIALHAENEKWATPSAFRQDSSAYWLR